MGQGWGKCALFHVFNTLGEYVLGEHTVLVGSHFKELQIAEGGVPPLKNAAFLKTSSFEDMSICGVSLQNFHC